MYLNQITFPDYDTEASFLMSIRRTVYDSFYPFQILCRHQLRQIDFDSVTILSGGNGSGKTTALNVSSELCTGKRHAVFNRTSFFDEYLSLCTRHMDADPTHTSILTSDDVFDYMLDVRTLNQGIDMRREDVFEEYYQAKYAQFRFKGFDDYEELKKINHARSKTQSKFTRSQLMDNVRTYSNGESSARFFQEKIRPYGLYFLDEPENSLSPKEQLFLVQLIEDYVRYEACQFVIATHSPFILSIKEAKVYDLDQDPVDVRPWTRLDNVQTYSQFFKQHREAFEEADGL